MNGETVSETVCDSAATTRRDGTVDGPEVIDQALRVACVELARLLSVEHVGPQVLLQHFGSAEALAPAAQARSTEALRQYLLQDSAEVPARPTPQLAAQAVVTFWNWARDGFRVVPPAVRAERLARCLDCPDYSAMPDTALYKAWTTAWTAIAAPAEQPRICRSCGCLIEKKARLAGQQCPRGRWPLG